MDAFVLSDNIISSLGFTTRENIESILAGKTGIADQDIQLIDPKIFTAGMIDRTRLTRLIQSSGLENISELSGLAVLSIKDALSQIQIELTGPKNLFILSTTKGNIAGLTGNIPPEEGIFLWHTAQTIARYFNMQQIPIVVSNACVSGVSAIETAARLLRENLYENIVVTGIDCISAFIVSGFESFRSLSHSPCKPYDINRDGLSLGEGVGTIILSNNEKWLTAEKKIRILSGATSNDANHISAPSRTGEGLHYAIENAIQYAGIDRNEIDFMNLHGTATHYNDDMESRAVALSGLSEVPANSFKGYFGHTLGASGVIETIVCMESIRRNQLVATLGFSQPGVPEEMNIINKNTDCELHTCLKTSSGFGGFNSAIIISDRLYSLKKEENKPSSVSPSSVCRIENKQVFINDKLVFENPESADYSDFIKSAFRNLEDSYPKFYKMDSLCKLGFTAVQYLLKYNPVLSKYDKKQVALIFRNRVSSLDTDIKHQQSIQDKDNYFPSPAIFVYTLPNIVLGEICIREKIQGEVSFFIFENDNDDFLNHYLRILFDTTRTEAAIVGKVDCIGEDYNAAAFFIEKSGCK